MRLSYSEASAQFTCSSLCKCHTSQDVKIKIIVSLIFTLVRYITFGIGIPASRIYFSSQYSPVS